LHCGHLRDSLYQLSSYTSPAILVVLAEFVVAAYPEEIAGTIFSYSFKTSAWRQATLKPPNVAQIDPTKLLPSNGPEGPAIKQ
jgi:hypothetical protein